MFNAIFSQEMTYQQFLRTILSRMLNPDLETLKVGIIPLDKGRSQCVSAYDPPTRNQEPGYAPPLLVWFVPLLC
jgi:hypothetical protein